MRTVDHGAPRMTCQGGLCTSSGRQCATDAGPDARTSAGDAGMDSPEDLSSTSRDATDSAAFEVRTRGMRPLTSRLTSRRHAPRRPDDIHDRHAPDVATGHWTSTRPPTSATGHRRHAPPTFRRAATARHPDTADGDGKAPEPASSRISCSGWKATAASMRRRARRSPSGAISPRCTTTPSK